MTFTRSSRPAARLESVLAIDLGTVNTRAHYFDLVDGRFRFIASACAPTTSEAPFSHVGYGIRAAIEELGARCGRVFLNDEGSLMMARTVVGSGVDGFVFSFSLGEPISAVLSGLHPAASLAAARDLAEAFPVQVTSETCLWDGQTPAQRMETWLRRPPELIVLSGGTDGGAREDVLSLARQANVFCHMLAKEDRPKIFFCGNTALHGDISGIFCDASEVCLSPNLRPAEGLDNGGAARVRLAEMVRRDRLGRVPGFTTPDAWAGGKSLPASLGMERTVRFLNGESKRKGVLAVDTGTQSLTLAAVRSEDSVVKIIPKVDRKQDGTVFISEDRLRSVMEWLYLAVPEDDVRDYLWNKLLYPASLPSGYRELAIEHAWTRAVLREAASAVVRGWQVEGSEDSSLPPIDPLIASGSALTHAPDAAYATLMLLDGFQPSGISTLLLDQKHLLAVLGASASLHPALPVQVIDSNIFTRLATVIAPICGAPAGIPLLRVRMLAETGVDVRLELRQGELKTLPLTKGERAQLWLKPLNGADIGMGPGRGGKLSSVYGGVLGVILDGRGRPFRLPSDWDERRSRYRAWLTALRGEG